MEGGLYKALKMASKAHEGQKRKGKNPAPYISHPVFVGMELLRLGFDEDTVVASILHDTLEDGFPSLERDAVKAMIRSEFGEKVFILIDAVTEPKDPNMTKEEKRRTWRARKDAYLEKLNSGSPEARAIACLDMYANMLELKHTLIEEGLDVLNDFNIGIDEKFDHWQKELNLFAEDKDYHHSRLILEMQNILKDIQKLIGS
jgi:(p)ppGpp synthase/HD superfamily hydrolase